MKNSRLTRGAESISGSFQMKSSFNLLLILTLITCVELEFTVSPTSQVVPTGLQQTIFYCIHTTAESIGWRVNDAPLAHQIYTGISACINRRRDGVIINRLKVDIEQAYDGLKIECAALFSDRPPIISEPANLTIEEDITFEEGFVTSPYIQIQNMTDLILALGEEAIFDCQFCTTEDISWIINGSTLDELNLPQNISITRHYNIRPHCGVLHRLTINNIFNYNQSTIKCGPSWTNQVSEPITLWVQGVLNPIQAIEKIPNDEMAMYTWNPPFSLNLTMIDPDITYCVSVYDVTCINQKDLISENCDIINPNYTIPLGILNSTNLFEIVVLPKINSPNALNRTVTIPTAYKDRYVFFDDRIVTYNLTISSNLSFVQLAGEFNLEAADPLSIRPKNYVMELRSLETDNEVNIMICPVLIHKSKPKRDGSIITWTLNCKSPLQARKLFLCTIFTFVTTTRCSVPVSDTIELSTHVIQNITANSTTYPGEITVSADFVQTTSTTSLGFLAIAYSDHSDIHYKIAHRTLNQRSAAAKLSGLSGNTYKASVFNIESTGLPFSKSATVLKNLSIIGVNDLQKRETDNFLQIEYTLEQPDCISCVFFNSSISHCLFIAFSADQLSSNYAYGLLEIDVHIEPNSTTFCTMNATDYIISVFGYSMDLRMIISPGMKVIYYNTYATVTDVTVPYYHTINSKDNSTTINIGLAVGVSIVSITTIIIILLVMLIIFWNKKKRKNLVHVFHYQQDD